MYLARKKIFMKAITVINSLPIRAHVSQLELTFSHSGEGEIHKSTLLRATAKLSDVLNILELLFVEY